MSNPGRYVHLYAFDADESDNGWEEVLGMDARMNAEEAGYHPTDDDAAVVWMQDMFSKKWAARVVVLVHEQEEIIS